MYRVYFFLFLFSYVGKSVAQCPGPTDPSSYSQPDYSPLGYYAYQDFYFTPSQETVTISCTANERPNRFTIYAPDGTQTTTGWIGYSNTGGPWGAPTALNGPSMANVSLTSLCPGCWRVLVEAGPDDHLNDAFTLGLSYSGAIVNNQVANAGPDQNICTGAATLSGNMPTAGSGTWMQISGPTSVIANPSSNNSTVNSLNIAGTYVYEWTINNPPCPPSSDQITIEVSNGTSTSFNYTSSTFCLNSPNEQPLINGSNSGTFSSSPLGLSLNMNTGEIDFTTSTVGSYTVTYTVSGSCGSASSQPIVVNPLPTASVSGTASVCRNGTSPVVTFTGSNGTQPYTFTYNINGAANQTIVSTGATATINVPTNVAGTFNYNLVSVQDGSASNCNQAQSGTAVITVNLLPTATLIGTTTVCSNSTPPVVTFTGSNGTAPYTFTYNINGGMNQTIISTGSTATISAPTSSSGAFNYNLVSVQDAGSSSCSQLQTGTATVTVNSLPTATISGTTSVCQNANSPIVTFTGNNGTSPYTFTYNIDGGPNQTVSSLGAIATISSPTNTVGTFTYNLVSVQSGNSTSCSQLQAGSIVITVNSAPTASISGNETVCLNEGSPVITFTGSNGNSPYTFTYNVNGGLDQTITSLGSIATISALTNTAGTFNYNLISVQDASGASCLQSQSGSALLTVNPLPTVDAGDAVFTCENNTVVLSASGAGVNAVYNWDNNVIDGVGFNPSIGNSTYSVMGTDANGCVGFDQVLVNVESTPILSFNFLQYGYCIPVEVSLTNTSIVPVTNCVWTFENGVTVNGCGPIVQAFTEPGVFGVTLYAESVSNGCPSSIFYDDIIEIDTQPTASFTTNTNTVSNIDSEVRFVNHSINSSSYLWDFGDDISSNSLNPEHSYSIEEAGYYSVILVAYSQNGCTDTARSIIKMEEELIYYVPNTFTPNSSEVNQYFYPVFSSGFDLNDYQLMIFNRWGELIFESNSPELGWDGSYGSSLNGVVLCEEGTYTWKIDFKIIGKDEMKSAVGHVNLLR